MRVKTLETFLVNAGLRNYLFLRLTTDQGLTGIGEASLEWQEQTVQTLIHELLEERYVIGCDPFDVEELVARMIRDQYQGGSTVMTAISGIEIALWDIIGKDCGKPIYQLIGGRCHERIPAYANGWYGGARTPEDYATQAKEVVRRGYTALKFDPFGVAWKILSRSELQNAASLVEGVRKAVGENVEVMIEGHGRFNVETAVMVDRVLRPYNPAWFEEPVPSDNIHLMKEAKARIESPVAGGERLYSIPDFYHLVSQRAADIIQMDLAHCGGILAGKKIAAIASAEDLLVAPHCSIGPVALAAALHFDLSTPIFAVQEAFQEFDVPWSRALVGGWSPIRDGYFHLGDEPGLGLDIDLQEISKHPYKKDSFPSLWDKRWYEEFTSRKSPATPR